MLSAVSGFLISWCSPEASVPRLTNRSIRRICSSIRTRSLTSRRRITQPIALPRRVLEHVGVGPDPPHAAAAVQGEILVPDRGVALGDPARQVDSAAPPGGDARQRPADALGFHPEDPDRGRVDARDGRLVVGRDDSLVHAGQDVEGEQLDLVQVSAGWRVAAAAARASPACRAAGPPRRSTGR